MPNEMFKFNCVNLPHNKIATNSKSKQHFFFFFFFFFFLIKSSVTQFINTS